jgi:methylmalonyl-CoA mutase, N-terminal domain
VERALDGIREAAQAGRNTMPPILDAVRAYATVGEMCDALRQVWGEYEEAAVI